MEVENINVDRILLDGESYKNSLIYDISYKNLMGEKPLRIRFNKVNGLIKICYWIRYLELFDSYNEFYYRNISRIYNAIFDWIKCLICEKNGITDSINHKFGRIWIDSYNSLPREKALTFHDVIILINSFFNENKNNDYCYNIVFEKGLHKCYISIELTFLKEPILKKQVQQKSVIFITIGIL